MKKLFVSALLAMLLNTNTVTAQDLKAKDVPEAVKTALVKKYPAAAKVSWEKEHGNYEANWGGTSGEDNSVLFSAGGNFISHTQALQVSQLPAAITTYVKQHYNNAAIKEAGKITNADGIITYEAELKGKDLIFDANGSFIKVDTED